MKAYTDIEQSKMLAEFLSVESADLIFVHTTDLEGDEHYDIDFRKNQPLFEDDIPCWSLAALLAAVPKELCVRVGYMFEDERGQRWFAYTKSLFYPASDPVDAAVGLIVELKKHNLIWTVRKQSTLKLKTLSKAKGRN